MRSRVDLISGVYLHIVHPSSGDCLLFGQASRDMSNSELFRVGGHVSARGSGDASSEAGAAISADLAAGRGSDGLPPSPPSGPCLLWELPSPQQMGFATAAFPTGVVLLAAQVEGRPAGILVNSFTSVSLDSPLVLVNIGRSSPTLKILESAAEWGISVLGADQQHQFEALARPAAERFNGLDLDASEGRGMVLAGAAAGFLVRRESKLGTGDHFIFLLRVQRLCRADVAPAVFFNKALHSLPQEAAPTPRLQDQTP